jgi:aryl-alcohol dehydrogenase-like predicted oxidoreductase
METTELGSTCRMVSRGGLGCGGNSRLGLGRGKTEQQCIGLVQEALIDTAQNYGTEAIVGQAIAGRPRDGLTICTKSSIRAGGERLSANRVIDNLHESLAALQTDVIDVFQLHGVLPDDYDYALDEMAPALLRAKEAGKIRHIGITETSPRDPMQTMLQRAVNDDPWEVVMLGFNLMNQGARKNLLPVTAKRGVGTLIMFAVRNVFSQPEALERTLRTLVDSGDLPSELLDEAPPLGFLIHQGGAANITEAAYRYVLHQPGVNTVLFGTGSTAHLRENVRTLSLPPLPAESVDKLHTLFSHLTGVGLDLPDRKFR